MYRNHDDMNEWHEENAKWKTTEKQNEMENSYQLITIAWVQQEKEQRNVRQFTIFHHPRLHKYECIKIVKMFIGAQELFAISSAIITSVFKHTHQNDESKSHQKLKRKKNKRNFIDKISQRMERSRFMKTRKQVQNIVLFASVSRIIINTPCDIVNRSMPDEWHFYFFLFSCISICSSRSVFFSSFSDSHYSDFKTKSDCIDFSRSLLLHHVVGISCQTGGCHVATVYPSKFARKSSSGDCTRTSSRMRKHTQQKSTNTRVPQ